MGNYNSIYMLLTAYFIIFVKSQSCKCSAFLLCCVAVIYNLMEKNDGKTIRKTLDKQLNICLNVYIKKRYF